MSIISFFIASAIIVLIPGTGVLYTVTTGLTHGRKKGIFAAIGCTLGIIPHLITSLLLMAFLVSLDTNMLRLITLPGIGYLIYLGIGMLRTSCDYTQQLTDINDDSSSHRILSHTNITNKRHPICAYEIILRGILINLLNPKLTLFFFSFLPQYVKFSTDKYMILSLIYGLGFMLLTVLIFCAYGLLAGTVKDLLLHSGKIITNIQHISGFLFILLAIGMLVS